MKLLAIDTAANLCAVAVFDTVARVVMAEAGEDIGKGHAERLMPMIDDCLHEAGVTVSEIGKVAVAMGPGSFTGIRVGVAAARGLGLALGCPVVGVTTLETLAEAARDTYLGRPVIAAIDARRGEVYAQAFGADGRPEEEPQVLTAQVVAGRIAAADVPPVLCGSAASLIAAEMQDGAPELAGTAATGPVAVLARLAADREATEAPKPLYLRAPDAKPQEGFALARSGRP
jgi:tRNA threonylcarbamoyladenosine biosynthesis protein TsaB